MSSHREAPETAKDPVADSTDVYAFVSPDRPDTVTLIANYIPFQAPDGGPNFYEFGDDVAYDINISNKGKGEADITYRFKFHTAVRNPSTFLYNTGPIGSINSPNWNRPQFYSVTRIKDGKSKVLASKLACPPVNIGPRSTPHYADLATAAVHKVGRRRVFAGQRADAFHVDLGSIFDLGTLRPFESLHLIPSANAPGVNSLQAFNVHSIAIQIPTTELTRTGEVPNNPARKGAVIGVWAAAYRRKSRIFDPKRGSYVGHGPWAQVSRLGNPLFNEVIVPMALKDTWNAHHPRTDSTYAKFVNHPELGKLLPVLYPGVFPHLAGYHKARADLNAILLTGIPAGVVPGFQNYTGPVESDMLRLNVAVPADHVEPQQPGAGRGGRRGLPERTPRGRRRGDHRAAGGGGSHDPARRPVVHARRCGQRHQRRHDQHQHRHDGFVPLPRQPRGGLPDHAGNEHGMSSAENPFAGQGAVLLDIGGDVGALVVTMPRAMVDTEVEIRPVGADHSHEGHPHDHGDHGHGHHDDGHGHLAHVAVVERPVGDGTVPSLVFGELTAGGYDLFEKGRPDAVVLTVEVEGGQVATASWPL